MRITKLKIKNLFGIKEYEGNGNNCEIVGTNGAGKTSILEAIRYALTNRSGRDMIIRDGSEEGYIYIETDTGISIERKKRRDKVDTVSVKDNGTPIKKTIEAFLRELFTTLQLNPVDFIAMDAKEQNRIILDLIDFKWDLNWIREQFGEIVPEVNYEQNILRVLHDIQAENGFYFQRRQDINREIRNKRAFIEEIGKALPPKYNAENWRKVTLSDKYTTIEKIKQKNREVEKAQVFIKSADDKIRAFDADRQIKIGAVEKETASRRNQIEQSIIKLREQIKAYETELAGLEEKKKDKIAVANSEYDANVAEFKAKLEEYKPVADRPMQDTSELEAEAGNIENMKSFINEYDRMVGLQEDVSELTKHAEELTAKIEKARTLPGEILQNCQIPVENLSIVDGEPRIKGLPINNLSDGEKLNLCIDIAKENKQALNLLLIDGIEKLSQKNRDILYEKCKSRGVQFLATRTTNDEDLTVIEL